jgi:hypothetical protein
MSSIEDKTTAASRFLTGFLLASTLLLFVGVLEGDMAHVDWIEMLFRKGALVIIGTVAFARLQAAPNV